MFSMAARWLQSLAQRLHNSVNFLSVSGPHNKHKWLAMQSATKQRVLLAFVMCFNVHLQTQHWQHSITLWHGAQHPYGFLEKSLSPMQQTHLVNADFTCVGTIFIGSSPHAALVLNFVTSIVKSKSSLAMQ